MLNFKLKIEKLWLYENPHPLDSSPSRNKKEGEDLK
jgi:hypothetical protein